MTRRYDYLTVGHLTRDAIEDGRGGTLSQPGGGAFYSALQAARLGLRTLIVTQGVPHEIEALLEPYRTELDLHVVPAAHTTTLATHGSGSGRSQRVLSWAGPMNDSAPMPGTEILHLAPVARETPAIQRGRADFLGITPQGLIRRWKNAGEISLTELDPTILPDDFDAAVIGEQERPSCEALFTAARGAGAFVAVTDGPRPTTVHAPTTVGAAFARVSVPSTATVGQDLGAGDVFAAAFFVSLWQGNTPLRAVTFANAAAALRVAGAGPSAIGDRRAIEAVMAQADSTA